MNVLPFRFEPAAPTAGTNTHVNLFLCGDWRLGSAPEGAALYDEIPGNCTAITLDTTELEQWDSSLMIALLQLARRCEEEQITLDTSSAPESLQQLLNLAISIPPYQPPAQKPPLPLAERIHKGALAHWQTFAHSLMFIGDISLACNNWVRGKADTRRQDLVFFIDQAGPRALPIVTLIALLVGMILAYLGSVQLRQLGAQIYIADLVAVGMVREMGALMIAVIMAGRTGAAYAAQLGTMQVNEEIDALKTMGISTIEFLVLPRLLALVLIMPILCIYADVVGIIGGALIATSMDVNLLQYILQTQGAITWSDIFAGLIKSVCFGILIAIAGCQAGINCGRNSDAVGMAATNAVVRAIVYLVIADAAFNVLFDHVNI